MLAYFYCSQTARRPDSGTLEYSRTESEQEFTSENGYMKMSGVVKITTSSSESSKALHPELTTSMPPCDQYCWDQNTVAHPD